MRIKNKFSPTINMYKSAIPFCLPSTIGGATWIPEKEPKTATHIAMVAFLTCLEEWGQLAQVRQVELGHLKSSTKIHLDVTK